MKKRLQNVLAHAGIASRRRAAQLIENGKVKVDGKVVTEKGHRIDPEEHKILIDGRPLPKEEKKYYFLFNKPENVISTVSDTHDRKKVTDYFKKIKARLYPVGRLDKDTTGLLVVTNDGTLTHRLAHPSFEIEKEYRVTITGYLSQKDSKRLERGIDLEGKKTAPCIIRRVKRTVKGDVLKIVLHEGRKRQIRLMLEEVGAKVTALERTRYANLTLGCLKPGEYRELTQKEVEKLFNVGQV
ncbi:MAG: pseudouridine synthase [Candidatus Omnitrophota bacterium]